LEPDQKPRARRVDIALLAVLVVAGLLGGGMLGYVLVLSYTDTSGRIEYLQNQLSALQRQISSMQSAQGANFQTTYVFVENVSLSQVYEKVKESVVTIRGILVQYDIFRRAHYGQVQGSGFVYNFSGQMLVITNNHVVDGAVNITVTFINGNGYAAKVLGSDPYVDLAVLRVNAPMEEYKPLDIVSSSTLKVGDPVIVVGNPYGLAGSMSFGIVSALGRTISEERTGGYAIANVIQTTAPLNPGNSGGPLLNYRGQVVGITTAIISDSQGLGFAIPSNTILREIGSLVKEGSYNRHPWLGVAGVDMSYELARAMGVNVTYGWLITEVVSGGPADSAGLRGGTRRALVAGDVVTVGGDIVIAIDGFRVRNADDLSTYLEENTSPDQTVRLTIVRGNEVLTVSVKLGTRPSA
jgi:S1-C subfamily serine protease